MTVVLKGDKRRPSGQGPGARVFYGLSSHELSGITGSPRPSSPARRPARTPNAAPQRGVTPRQQPARTRRRFHANATSPDEHGCKTAGSAYVRSNPTPATHLRRSEPVTLECVTGFSRERERLRRPSDVPRGPCVGQIRPSADVGDERSIWRLSCGNDPQRKHLLMPRAGVRGRARCCRRERRPRQVLRWRSATTTRRHAAGRTGGGPAAWRPAAGRARSRGRRARLRPRRSSVAGPAGSLLLLANRREARVVAQGGRRYARAASRRPQGRPSCGPWPDHTRRCPPQENSTRAVRPG